MKLKKRFQSFSDLQLAGLFFDIRFKIKSLPPYLELTSTLVRIKNYLKKLIKDDDIEMDNIVEIGEINLMNKLFKFKRSQTK